MHDRAWRPEMSTLDASVLARAFERDDVANALHARGFAVVDDVLDVDYASNLKRAVEALARDGHVKPNVTSFARGAHAKPRVYECDMNDIDVEGKTRGNETYDAAWEFYDGSAEAFARALKAVVKGCDVESGAFARAVKTQVNYGGGACFPWHYDNPGAPSKRSVSCILYLNEDWRPGDGGELVLQPFCDVATRVAPIHNRMAIFYSDRTLHRVLPSNAATRYAVTVWIDGNFTNADGTSTNTEVLELNASEAMRDIAATAASLRASNAQRALSRAVYADEYEQSLVECMSSAPQALEEMLEAHYDHCRAVKKQPGLKALVDALREHRLEVESRRGEESILFPSKSSSKP